MSKKYYVIGIAVTLLILAGGGYYAYKNIKIEEREAVLTPAELLSSFANQNPNLSEQEFKLFQQRYDETKAKLQANPDNFNSWLYLGVLKKGISDYEGARDVFIYAGQIRPQSTTPFANLADLYAYFLDEPVKAEEAIKKAIANDPNDYNFRLSLADIYRYKFAGGNALAEQTLLEADAKWPDNVNVISSLAAFYRDTDQAAKAIERYEKLVKLAPDNAAAKEDLAELMKIKP